jgi:hypothetical protein
MRRSPDQAYKVAFVTAEDGPTKFGGTETDVDVYPFELLHVIFRKNGVVSHSDRLPVFGVWAMW